LLGAIPPRDVRQLDHWATVFTLVVSHRCASTLSCANRHGKS
jgi:hypothetical protein